MAKPVANRARVARLAAAVVVAVGLSGSAAGAADPPRNEPKSEPKNQTRAAPMRPPNPTAALDPAKAGPDFATQGEYVGETDLGALGLGEGRGKVGAQVIALGHGTFHAVFYAGGLPGEGWQRGNKRAEADGRAAEDGAAFTGAAFVARVKGQAPGQSLGLADASGKELGTLAHVLRQSPTQGKAAPDGAVVLFDGKNADEWKGGKVDEEGRLVQGPTSKRAFKDFHLHVEFMLSFMPEARGQGRSNSGVYLQGRYEIQVLDSFGLKGENNECGGIYTISAPAVNLCYPPLSWQTYDADFTAARWEGGKKVQNAKVTVRHNGVEIQKDVEIPHATTAAPVKEGPEPGPIYLQDHGNPVRFRNVWVVER